MLLSLTPIALLVGMLAASVSLFGSDASQGPNQIALVVATGAAALVGLYRGLVWEEIQDGMAAGIRVGLNAMLILLAVGALIGSWIIAGTVPAMIYYGVALLDPGIFYSACAVISALASISIGSSWTVAGTIGIGLMGISNTYGLSPAITAGAIISGAYFGDKLSPLSDTTNLAAACAGVDLFSHIRHMLWTTVPAFAIAMLFFLMQSSDATAEPEKIAALRNALAAQFDVGPWVLLPLVGMLTLVAMKVPAYPAVLLSTLVGCVFAVVFQADVVRELALLADAESTQPLITGVWLALFDGYTSNAAALSTLSAGTDAVITTSTELAVNAGAAGGADGEMSAEAAMDELLSKGGMASMMNTIWLIIAALAFGGVLERTGILKDLLDAALRRVRSTGDLVLATVTSGAVTNMLAADQFLAIALPGRLFAIAYDDRGLSRLNLSRSLEDSATLTSVLIPWNTCGAYMAATLQIATLEYAPYAVFNYICPLIAIALGYLLIAQKRVELEFEPA